jgi:hypothetical protein
MSGWRKRCDCHWVLADLCRACSEALAPRAMASRNIIRVDMGRVNKWRRRLSLELPTFKSQEAPVRDRPLWLCRAF